jgi:hypothetical protein
MRLTIKLSSGWFGLHFVLGEQSDTTIDLTCVFLRALIS